MIAGKEKVDNRLGGQGVNQETPRNNSVNIESKWHLDESIERAVTGDLWGAC